MGLLVRVFTKACSSVHLSLNGKLVATAPVQANFTAVFEVVYQPGELVAQTSCVPELHRVPHIVSMRTAGKPAALVLSADRSAIRHSTGDLAYVTIMVVDSAGQLVPEAA